MPLAKNTMTTGRVTYLGRTAADRHGAETPRTDAAARQLPIRTGDRFRQVRPPGHVLSVARVVHPRSGRPHAWLRFVDGTDRAGTHMFVSLEALRDHGAFVRVSSAERESYGKVAAFSAGSPR